MSVYAGARSILLIKMAEKNCGRCRYGEVSGREIKKESGVRGLRKNEVLQRGKYETCELAKVCIPYA